MCKNEQSFLCIVCGEFDGQLSYFYGISGFFCFECINSEKLLANVCRKYSEFMLLTGNVKKIKEELTILNSIKDTPNFTKKVEKKFSKTLKYAKILNANTVVYNKNFDVIEKSLSEYTEKPVMIFLDSTIVENGLLGVSGFIGDIEDNEELQDEVPP